MTSSEIIIILAIAICIPILIGVSFWFVVLAIAKNLDMAPFARKDPLNKAGRE